MLGIPIPALLSALGLLVALELVYLLVLRRYLPRLIERTRYQSFVIAATAVVLLALSRDVVPERALDIASFIAAVVTVDLLYRLLDRFWLSQQRDRKGRLAVPKLVRDLAAWLLILAAIVVAAHYYLGVPYNQITLSATVLSAVVGFALQDLLKNVFAGLSLQTEAPFSTGDWLMVDGEPRQVLEMTWRSTHLRNNLGVDFREPNSNLANAEIVNLGAGQIPMGFEIEVSLTYGAPPRQVKDSLERAARNSPAVAPSPPPVGLLVAFGDSGVVYRLRFWSKRVASVARLLDEVRSRVWYQLRRDGFTIPFPIRTVEYDSARAIATDRRAAERSRAEELISEIDFFAALPPEARRRLAETARHRHYDAGEKLVTEGEVGASLFVIGRGRVIVSKSGTDIGASSVALASLGVGDYFGEMSLLTGAPVSASVSAEGAVEVYVLDHRAVAPILEGDPRLAQTLSRVLAQRVADTIDRFEDRRDELQRTVAVEERTLLQKISRFFRLDD